MGLRFTLSLLPCYDAAPTAEPVDAASTLTPNTSLKEEFGVPEIEHARAAEDCPQLKRL